MPRNTQLQIFCSRMGDEPPRPDNICKADSNILELLSQVAACLGMTEEKEFVFLKQFPLAYRY